jgi:hypothetical protein
VPYWASPKDCRACALKPRCTKGQKRIVTRNFFEAEREHVRALKGTEAFERSARERRRIEMLFAHLKRNLNSRRVRGITGAADEFLLAATKPEEIGPIYRRAPGNNGRQARLSRTIISLHETDLSISGYPHRDRTQLSPLCGRNPLPACSASAVARVFQRYPRLMNCPVASVSDDRLSGKPRRRPYP